MSDITRPMQPDEVVSKAMVMLGTGYSSQRVSDATGIPSSTIRQWSRSPEITAKYSEATKAARERIAYRTGQIYEDELDKIEAGTVTVSPLQAATMWGIATDKVQKESSPSKGQAFVIVRSSDGSTIEVGVNG